MIQDLHLHSNYSDGENTLREMIEEAISLGIQKLGFTDHVWKTSNWINHYIEELKSLQKEYISKIKIYSGFEAKLINLEGELDIQDALYDRNIRIVASIHRIPKGKGEYISKSKISENLELSKEFWLKSFKSLVMNDGIDCIAHPFSLFESMGISNQDDLWWQEISTIIDSMPFKIEYNVKYNNELVPDWIWVKHRDKIVLGSDSHSVIDLKNRYKELLKIGKKIRA
jgi:putative hydrolase